MSSWKFCFLIRTPPSYNANIANAVAYSSFCDFDKLFIFFVVVVYIDFFLRIVVADYNEYIFNVVVVDVYIYMYVYSGQCFKSNNDD